MYLSILSQEIVMRSISFRILAKNSLGKEQKIRLEIFSTSPRHYHGGISQVSVNITCLLLVWVNQCLIRRDRKMCDHALDLDCKFSFED